MNKTITPISSLRKLTKAFTLIEVVMALALGSLVLVAGTAMIFSFSELWVSRNAGNFLEEHVNGLNLFLNKHLNRATFSFNNDTPVTLGYPPKISRVSDPYFCFKLQSSPALLHGETIPKGTIDAYLTYKNKEGLILMWYAPRDDENQEKKLNKVILSHWVTGITYLYYNDITHSWEEEKRIKPSNRLIPNGIKLDFQFKDKKTSTFVAVGS